MCVILERNIVEGRGKMHNIQVHVVDAFIAYPVPGAKVNE